jgi:hypothetical protein
MFKPTMEIAGFLSPNLVFGPCTHLLDSIYSLDPFSSLCRDAEKLGLL